MGYIRRSMRVQMPRPRLPRFFCLFTTTVHPTAGREPCAFTVTVMGRGNKGKNKASSGAGDQKSLRSAVEAAVNEGVQIQV